MNKKNIIITESQFNRLFNLSKQPRNILTEGAIDNYVKRTIASSVDESFQPYLNTSVNELPEKIKNYIKEISLRCFEICSNNNEPLLQYFRYNLLSYFDIQRKKGPIEYLKGITRIACEELGMFNSSHDESSLANFKQNVLFIHNNPQLLGMQFDKDLNNLHYEDFTESVNEARRAFNRNKRLNHVARNNNSNYRIVQINSFEEASKYGQYTSWCVTHSIGNYQGYTKGGNRFYFCLENGFENIPEESTDDCPLDKYGLSMIAVLIDIDGEKVHITTRWNHKYDGEDNENLNTSEQFEEVTGIDWYSSFIPYTPEELKSMGIIPFCEVQGMLDSGVDPEDIFDEIEQQPDGYRIVNLNNKCNFINSNGRIVSKKWYDTLGHFVNGYAKVKLGGKYNFINDNGQLLLKKWCDTLGYFYNGYARVELGGKYNFINGNGQLILKDWCDNACNFVNGYARVELGDKQYMIDTNGNIVNESKKSNNIIITESQFNRLFRLNETYIPKPNFNTEYVNTIEWSCDFDEDDLDDELSECETNEERQEAINDYYNNLEIDTECYDGDYEHLGWFTGNISDIEAYFGERTAREIMSDIKQKQSYNGKVSDILYDKEDDVDYNNADSVNAYAEHVLQNSNGESAYVLPNGKEIWLTDHCYVNQLSSRDVNMTKAKFMSYGSVRLGSGTVGNIGLMKMPTSEQFHSITDYIRRYANTSHFEVQFCSYNEGDVEPKPMFTVPYSYPDPNRVKWDIIHYYRDGIKPTGGNEYEY